MGLCHYISFCWLGAATIFAISPATFPALAADCVLTPPGLVGWWPGDGHFYDFAGTSRGVKINDVSFAPGKVGESISINGAGSGVEIGSPASLQLQSFTIEAWIKRGSAVRVAWEGNVAGVVVGYGWGGYAFALQDDGGLFLTKVGFSSVSSTLSLTDANSFHHVAVTKSGGTVIFFLDGIADSVGPYDPGFVFVNGPAVIGARGPDLINSFLGLIDEMSIYNHALSTAEVVAIYNAGTAGRCKQPFITVQPVSQVGFWGQNSRIDVIAVASGRLSYQWLKDGSPIAGATNATLLLNDLRMTDAGVYAVVVDSGYGSVISDSATLTMNPAGVSLALYAGVTIQGVVGKTYGIQYSADLSQANDWVGLTNLTLTQPVQLWYETQPANRPRRFYRVIPGPIPVP